MKKSGAFLAVLTATLSMAQTPNAIVLDGAGPWRNANWSTGVTAFTSLLRDAGYNVATVSPVDLASAPPASDVLLAVPSIESLPLSCFQAIAAFATAGGTLMASGGEPFRDPLYSISGQWVDANAALQALSPAKTILDPVNSVLTPVILTPETVTQTTVTGYDGQSKALDFQLQIPQSQYYLLTAPLTKPIFAAGQTATILWTRGTPGQGMLLEWDESDGSRWIATIPLASQWTKQVLLPSDFKYHSGGAASRATTTFNPAQASGIYFGAATGLGAQPGPMEFALSAIGAAAVPTLPTFPPPVIETLSPSYKQYVTQMAGQSVRVPVARGRGLSATADPDGRYRAIGDPLVPAATWYVTNSGQVTIWLPWPQLQDPQRGQLVSLLQAAPNHLYLLNAGPTQIVTLPAEDIVLGARVLNASKSGAAANLSWSVTDSMGNVDAQFTLALTLTAGQLQTIPTTDAGNLPPGDYTVTAVLSVGTQEVDRISSHARIFDPTLTMQPNQQIVVANGAFATAAGNPMFLQGVNYWPRYDSGLETARLLQSWLSPQNYDPDLVEADLAIIASLNFNLVSLQYASVDGARSLVDFLDRCRNHGLWANIYIPAFVPSSTPAVSDAGLALSPNPNIGAMLQSAFLPGNDRVFAYDLLWEPRLGVQAQRVGLDNAWRTWLTDQYGSTANAEMAWGFSAPRDAQGQLSNPTETQIETDGQWRVMVAAYRRFADDQLGRSFGRLIRAVRAASPGTLVSFRNGYTGVNSLSNDANMAYDLGTAAAHLDFVSPEAYFNSTAWPDARNLGFATAYGSYRSGGKPVYWAEYGFDVGPAGGTAQTLATQAANCDTIMRVVNEDGSAAASVWWLPGGWRVNTGDDYGILNADGSPRASAQTLAKWAATFAAAPPSQGARAPVTLTVDRDADARGQYGVFVNWQSAYVQAKQAGSPVVLKDAGTGSDTSSMPLVQVGNVPYAGSGPLKYANGEFAGIHVVCPAAALDLRVENGAQVPVPAGSDCTITPSVVNTGEATWLPSTQSRGGVALHTAAGDLQLQNPLGPLQRTDLAALQLTTGQSDIRITGRLTIQGVGPFGETFNFTLQQQ